MLFDYFRVYIRVRAFGELELYFAQSIFISCIDTIHLFIANPPIDSVCLFSLTNSISKLRGFKIQLNFETLSLSSHSAVCGTIVHARSRSNRDL